MNAPRKWELPLTGWRGYGGPSHPMTPKAKPIGNRCGVYRHEMDAEVADYRLRHEGIKPELLLYIDALGFGSKRL